MLNGEEMSILQRFLRFINGAVLKNVLPYGQIEGCHEIRVSPQRYLVKNTAY